MTLIAEDQYEEFAELAENFDCSASPDYSGRGMYGQTCMSVSGDPSDLHRLLFAAVKIDGVGEVIQNSPSHDSMGLGQVLYWRNVQVEGHARQGWC